MKTTQSLTKSNRMSIEVFDPKMLKETNLFAINDFSFEEEWIETETEIAELSFEEFAQTLN